MGTKILAHTPAAAFSNNAFADVWIFRFFPFRFLSLFSLFVFFPPFFFQGIKSSRLGKLACPAC